MEFVELLNDYIEHNKNRGSICIIIMQAKSDLLNGYLQAVTQKLTELYQSNSYYNQLASTIFSATTLVKPFALFKQSPNSSPTNNKKNNSNLNEELTNKLTRARDIKEVIESALIMQNKVNESKKLMYN